MIKAKYTVVLKTLMDDPRSREAIDKALSHYPLFQPEKVYDLIPERTALNERLLNHYKYREIGFETVGRFLDELKITMGEIMPRYNELFKTVVTMAELPSPFDNVDVTETFEQERTGHETSAGSTNSKTTGTASDTTNTENNVESKSKRIESSTPQNELTIPAEGIDTVGYADKADWGRDKSDANGSSTSNSSTSADSEASSETENSTSETLKHTFTKKGNQGVNTYAHDMLEYRTAIIDVVDQIINDPRISELFMMVY